LARFDEGVVTGLDDRGFPVSVRLLALPYDAETGRLALSVPDALGVTEGPANLLCHFHDDALWSIRAIQLKGRLVHDGAGWTFETTAFAPPSMIGMIRRVYRGANGYLAKRNLPRPKVAFDVIERLWQRARTIEKP
jgi:hypothetical protein